VETNTAAVINPRAETHTVVAITTTTTTSMEVAGVPKVVHPMVEVGTMTPTEAKEEASTTAMTTALSSKAKEVTATVAVIRALADLDKLTAGLTTSLERSSKLLNTPATLPTVICSAMCLAC
jgi:hypothetical protein